MNLDPEHEREIDRPTEESDVSVRLVRRARGGERAAFEQLYRSHTGRVYALALRMAGEPRRAEELTQDVWVRVWERLESFRGESAFSTWLHRVATNVILQEFRGEKRRRSRVKLAGAPGQGAGGGSDGRRNEAPRRRWRPSADPSATAEDRISGIDLERALAELPERARTVFVLHDVEGYRHAEIAELMDTAVGTSKSQLFRARKLLRERLEA